MSTDVIPMHALLFRARRDLDEALASKEQAERAQTDAEEVARRAEERAHNLTNDRDSWVGFANALLTPKLHYFDPDLDDSKIAEITDLAYDLHVQGQEISDSLLAELVNDWTEQ